MHETIIQRALISVYDKSNIIELAEALHLLGVELLSTGNTAVYLQQHGLPVKTVGEFTGFPEIMDGRLKTLHPKIFGGILGRRDIDADTMITHHIPDIDLVVVNLYPFEAVKNNPDSSLAEIIENIDIGGPSLIRAAAKNNEWTTVLVDAKDYDMFIQSLRENKGLVQQELRFKLAAKAFAHTAAYESNIANFFNEQTNESSSSELFPGTFSIQYPLKERLRYGENAHQEAALYQQIDPPQDSIVAAVKLQGKLLSYNNLNDADTALECVKQFDKPACVIVKHANPCGVALASTPHDAYDKAYQADPISAFGGIIAFNQEVDETLIKHIFSQQFVEVLIAPQFSAKALQLAQEKPNCRLLQYFPTENPNRTLEMKSIGGGLLVQTTDNSNDTLQFEVVTTRHPSAEEMANLQFSWRIVKYAKSNAIVFANGLQTVGIGTGQMSRIFSTHIAALKAQESNLNLKGAVMASDAFFPFADNLEKAHELGITAIIQPGGAQRDIEIIALANQLGIAMVFTGLRCFRH